MFKVPILSSIAAQENCFSCKLFTTCKDQHKSIIYKCGRHATTTVSIDSGKKRVFDTGIPELIGVKEKRVITRNTAPEEFNVHKMLNESMSQSSMSSRDIKVDDRDFKLAPNFYTFCTSKNGLDTKPYTEQALIATIVFAEYCPRCSDKRWMVNHDVSEGLDIFRERVTLLKRGICPRCRARKHELVASGELNFYYEMAISAGQRSGKSALVGMMAAYLCHWLIMIQKPNEIYGLLDTNILRCTFVSLTFQQAKENLWDPFYGYVANSPWFTKYHSFLDDTGNRLGEDLYKFKDTFVVYNHRRIQWLPASPDGRTLRGRTRSFGSIDEIAHFDHSFNNKKVKNNAASVYVALANSLLTVREAAEILMRKGFDNIPTGYFLNISSPLSARDKIMELVRQSKHSTKIYGCVKPTWEMNPTLPRHSASIQEAFKQDPIIAMRDFGAVPPLTSSPFITSIASIEQCFSGQKNPVRLEYHTDNSSDGTKTRYGTFSYLKKAGYPSVLAIDAGYSYNSFAVALGHLVDERTPVIDLMVEIQPLPGIPLNYTYIFAYILCELIEHRNVKLIVADRWNSLKILQDASAAYDISYKQVSIKYPQMQLFKDYMQDGEMIFPSSEEPVEDTLKYRNDDYPACFKDKTIAHFVLQLLTVQDIGSSVIKGENLTDDLVRASMLAVSTLIDPSNTDYFTSAMEEPTPQHQIRTYAVAKGLSRASGRAGLSSNLGIGKSRSRS